MGKHLEDFRWAGRKPRLRGGKWQRASQGAGHVLTQKHTWHPKIPDPQSPKDLRPNSSGLWASCTVAPGILYLTAWDRVHKCLELLTRTAGSFHASPGLWVSGQRNEGLPLGWVLIGRGKSGEDRCPESSQLRTEVQRKRAEGLLLVLSAQSARL